MGSKIIFYGDKSKVNLVSHKDYNDYLKNTEKKQELSGFGDEYLDIVDYILKITHRIWEEKNIGLIYDTYHNDCIVHTGNSTNAGIKGVIAGTLGTLHSFPDRRLIGEDVVWSEDKPGVFFSSHRILSTATNTGDSSLCPATFKRIHFRTIADCAVSENRIFEEWLVRDNLWIVHQLGLDPYKVAKEMAVKMSNKKTANKGFSENCEGQFFPESYKPMDDSTGEMMLAMHIDIFGAKHINLVKNYFSDNAIIHYIDNEELVGHDEIQGSIISLLASFPDARFSVDRITVNDQEDGSEHVSVRWRLRGLHEGLGFFGEPSNNMVEIMGISQYRVEDSKITEGFVIYDALDVMRQIYIGKEDDETELEF